MEYCTDDHFYDDNGGGCGWEPKDSIENTRHILRTTTKGENITCICTVGGEKVQHQVTMQTELVELWHQIESATPFGSGVCWEKQWARCKEYGFGTVRLVGDLWVHR